MKETQDKFWRWKNPILWALLSTSMFFGLLATFALTPTCNIESFPKGDCPPKWRHLLVAPPNEVGDTLAGLAGVLAFIWLIATVLLQAQELRAQRKEFREQREATQDMARAMSAQARIFEDEQRQRDELRAHELLDEKLRSIVIDISESGRSGLVWHFSNAEIDDEFGSNSEIHSRTVGELDFETLTIDDAVIRLRRKLYRLRDELWDFVNLSIDYRLPANSALISELIQKIRNVISMKDQLSLPQQERLDRMRFGEIIERLTELQNTKQFWQETNP